MPPIPAHLDPETAEDLHTMGVYHFEDGARDFATWRKAMVDDLGKWVEPYLASQFDATVDRMRVLVNEKLGHILSQGERDHLIELSRDLRKVAPALRAGESKIWTPGAARETQTTIEPPPDKQAVKKADAAGAILNDAPAELPNPGRNAGVAWEVGPHNVRKESKDARPDDVGKREQRGAKGPNERVAVKAVATDVAYPVPTSSAGDSVAPSGDRAHPPTDPAVARASTERWRIETHDRYMKLVTLVILLDAAFLVLSVWLIFHLKRSAWLNFRLERFGWRTSYYANWGRDNMRAALICFCFGGSILFGLAYSWLSLTWVKVAWGHQSRQISERSLVRTGFRHRARRAWHQVRYLSESSLDRWLKVFVIGMAACFLTGMIFLFVLAAHASLE